MQDTPADQTDRSGLAIPSGLILQMNANGSVRRLDHGDIILNLFPGNEVEGGPTRIYLRRLGQAIDALPLLDPCSRAAVQHGDSGTGAVGTWQDIRFRVWPLLAASAPAWFWHVELENTGRDAATLDLIYTQDLALAHYGAVRLNEYYVSQYIDHTPLNHPERGVVVASRQNQSMAGRHPWCVIGSLRHGARFATDALQVHGLATRAGQAPLAVTEGLPGARLQHEHAMAAIQDAPVRLEPGERARCGFFGWFEPDHPAATSAADVAFVDRALALPEATAPATAATDEATAPSPSLFSTAPLLDALELSEDEIHALFGDQLRETERDDNRLLSFFAGEHSHVVLKAKELKVLRPHGHILRTGSALIPDEAALTSTAWMAGVFHSMVTQGHVSINRFLSTTHSYLGLFRSFGQRLFIDLGDGWQLLDVPSAFEMAPTLCRWYYKHQRGLIRVDSSAHTDRHELHISAEVMSGPPPRFLVSNNVALNGDDGASPEPVQYCVDAQGVVVRPVANCDVGWRFPQGFFRIDPLDATVLAQCGSDELLFADGQCRGQPFLCLITTAATSMRLRLTGHLIEAPVGTAATADRDGDAITGCLRLHPPVESPFAADAARLAEILVWFADNTLIHYLAPRGLEQYSGGGWGTRDVSQGPVEMLLALGRVDPVRDLLIRVFKQQNPDGDWPQWFMFFDRESIIRPGDSHGDIVFWPLLALARYLLASEDASILDQTLPFFTAEPDEDAESVPIRQHVERALKIIRDRVIPGTALAAYGHGDWNDTLQPADPAMRERLCSAWTVTLHYQTIKTLAAAYDRLGLVPAADEMSSMARQVRDDFQRLLVVDTVLCGFAYFHDDGRIDYLLHPRDTTTGLSYSLLAMVHAITNDLFTPEQARHHFALIGSYLLGQDGARLFDRPMAYHGGAQTYFQRAETATFFGREIGLMYTHAHLRYAEALWRYGDAQAFFRALCKVNPLGIRALVPASALRQANCYYSSSDAAFSDRYEASEQYERATRGEVPLEGGWRIYSSGAGISVGLIITCLLGLRQEKSMFVIDPVIPAELDGLRVELTLFGRSFEVTYRINGAGCGPSSIALNGTDLPFSRRQNPYRVGAVEIAMAAIFSQLTDGLNRLSIHIG